MLFLEGTSNILDLCSCSRATSRMIWSGMAWYENMAWTWHEYVWHVWYPVKNMPKFVKSNQTTVIRWTFSASFWGQLFQHWYTIPHFKDDNPSYIPLLSSIYKIYSGFPHIFLWFSHEKPAIILSAACWSSPWHHRRPHHPAWSLAPHGDESGGNGEIIKIPSGYD